MMNSQSWGWDISISDPGFRWVPGSVVAALVGGAVSEDADGDAMDVWMVLTNRSASSGDLKL